MRAASKPIFLIGMMGCGKSTLGKLLAERLDLPFTDLDEAIERFEAQSIPAIFSAVGDAGFRILETAALRRACNGKACVIATGGGIVTREENIALMRESGTVVWLCRPLTEILTTVDAGNRPNLAGDKEERMRTLYTRREPLYRRAAHITFDNRVPPGEAAKLLAHHLIQHSPGNP